MSKQVVSADGTTFTFGGVVVGGITEYTLVDGVTPDIEHDPMAGPRAFFPGIPDYGTVRLTLYRNPSDPGQKQMEDARAAMARDECVITLIDGTTRRFTGYVKQIPLMGGGINGVGVAQIVLKVAGPTSNV